MYGKVNIFLGKVIHMKEKIKIGYIGLGRRGCGVLEKSVSLMKDVEVAYLCDTYKPALEKASKFLKNSPVLTTDYHDILNDPEVDAVLVMCGWEGRSAIAEESMLAGKYTAIEVGCAYDISECYRLIDIYEKTHTPLMMLENCCYGRREMMALKLVKEGLFGEVVHADGGYMHYLPEEDLFNGADDENPHYRLKNYIYRNCEQYPTHELGPIAKALNINRGNRFLSLVSVASKSRGLKHAAEKLYGKDSAYANMEYKQGDIINTIITCAGGETIHLCLDTTLPRPYYSRNFTIRGTKGMYTEERKALYFEGMTEKAENNEEEMFKKYDHPLHSEYALAEKPGGHGGMDWLVIRGFVEAVKAGTNTPIDAYDTVTWMAIAPLSEASIQNGGAPVSFPDFTRGKWFNRKDECAKSKYSLYEIIEDKDTPIIP